MNRLLRAPLAAFRLAVLGLVSGLFFVLLIVLWCADWLERALRAVLPLRFRLPRRRP